MGKPASCEGAAIAGAAIRYGAEMRWAADVADTAVAEVEQVASGQVAAGDVVDMDAVDGRIRYVAVDDDDRDVAHAQGGGELGLIAGGYEQDPIHLLLYEQVHVEQLACGVAVGVAENYAEAVGKTGILDAAPTSAKKGLALSGTIIPRV